MSVADGMNVGMKRGGVAALEQRPLAYGDGRAAFGVLFPAHGLALLQLRRVTDPVQGADVAGGLHQVAQGAEHLCRVRNVINYRRARVSVTTWIWGLMLD